MKSDYRRTFPFLYIYKRTESARADLKNFADRKTAAENFSVTVYRDYIYFRYLPVTLAGFAAIASGVPVATILPPASPPFGPISIT